MNMLRNEVRMEKNIDKERDTCVILLELHQRQDKAAYEKSVKALKVKKKTH